MITNTRIRYGMTSLKRPGNWPAETSEPAQYAISDFLDELNDVPLEGKIRFVEDLGKTGTILNFSSFEKPNHPQSKDITIHGKFSLEDTYGDDDIFRFSDIPHHGNAVLIEHIFTGFYFAIYKTNEMFRSFQVYDFSGTKNNPAGIYWMNSSGMPDNWEPIDPHASGTKLGGEPLNSDGTLYRGLWPATDEGKYYFVAQCQLEDGRYLHVFQNHDRKTYNYAGLEFDDEGDHADPYSIVLLAGEPAGKEFNAENTGERCSISPTEAYARKPLQNATKYPGVWSQDETPPNDPNYELLLSFGSGAQCDGDTAINKFGGSEFNLFFNKKTGRAKVIM